MRKMAWSGAMDGLAAAGDLREAVGWASCGTCGR